MTPPVPLTLEELLTPAWLTAALSERFGEVEVTAVALGPVISRVSTNARFTITCAGALPDGLPSTLCAKGYFSETGRPFAHVGVREARFYRELARSTSVRTLHPVYAATDDAASRGVVITADVIAAGGTFLDALHPYSPDQAAQSLEQLATLHASTWADRRYIDAPWLRPMMATYLQARGLAEITANFDGPVGQDVPTEARDGSRLVDAIRNMSSEHAPEGASVIHGDAHVGNLFLDATGRPGMLDWQCVQSGSWAIDVGYHIASALTIADRERSERDLLQHYLERLHALDVDPPSWDRAWTGYRKGIVYGFFLWAITLHVEPAIIRTLLARLGAATAAHDCLRAAGA